MITDVAGDKTQLRRRLRAQRASALAPSGEPASLLRVAADAGLLDPSGRPGEIGPVTITAYVASAGEPDLTPLRAAVRAAGGRVLLPIPRPGRRLDWAEDDGGYAWDGALPVQVPTGPALGCGARFLCEQGVRLALVPALAVDGSGTRLGQGGGFYDVVLAELAGITARSSSGGGIAVLAVVHPSEVLESGVIPREPHDVTVAGALTAEGLLWFGA
jgi:5-formyltetrahydrofolate cyclo-ligase